jgi:hypothetical protein
MMTKRDRTAAVKQIRARAAERRDDVLDPKPVVAKWAPYPVFKVKPNPHADRGHRGDPCKGCKQGRPPGGWNAACSRGDVRAFQGG